MSESSSKPPASKAGSNPSLSGVSGQDPGSTAAGTSHRLPGAFVPPSDTLSRGVAKGKSKPTASTKSRSSTGFLVALIAGGALLFGLGAAALLLGGNDKQPLLVAEDAPSVDSVAATAAAQMGKAPLPDWVPTYPSGVQTMLVSNVVEGQPTGAIQFKTTNSHRSVIEYYRQKLEQNQFVLTSFTLVENTGVIEAKSPDGARKVIVMSEPSPEGAKANVVFTALDPDKSRPVPGGSLPKFAELFPGAKILEQSSRSENGAVFGHFRLKTEIKNREHLKIEIGSILDFYEPKIKAAHYKVKREDEPEFGNIEAVSRVDDGPVDLYVVEEEGAIIITMKVGKKE